MPDQPRRFEIIRTADVTGVSGTGVVADGCQFPAGSVAICWRGTHSSTVIWRCIEDALHVHGHAANTQIRWLDDEATALADLNPATVWVVPRQAAEPGWAGRGFVNTIPTGRTPLSPASARQLAAKMLAAADEAEKGGT